VRRIALEILAILLIGAGAGVLLNALRPDPLPYALPGTVLETECGVRAVFIREAHRLFEAGDYVFVDAREDGEFRAGHIEGALSLPAEQFRALYPELQVWAAGQPLLIYGASENLLAADELARSLREEGEPKLLIFAAGFEGWRARGYPTETGEAGRLRDGRSDEMELDSETPPDAGEATEGGEE
jgi:rhodanese-related sulfurtransferase